MSIPKLTGVMIGFYKNISMSEHSLKVFAYAQGIGGCEGVEGGELESLCAAALLHDVGIPRSIELYGNADGPNQEKEGAKIAPSLLKEAGIPESLWGKIISLIAQHHSEEAAKNDRLLQILMEADYLVNAAENPAYRFSPDAENTFFSTKTGADYLASLFLIRVRNR